MCCSLHNPNIRADRRTTLDAFLHTNRDYGKEVNHGRPLPDSLLVSLYSECIPSSLLPSPSSPLPVSRRGKAAVCGFNTPAVSQLAPRALL